MTPEDLLDDFIGSAHTVIDLGEPEDTVGVLWYRLCVRAVAMNDGAPSIADEVSCACWCRDMWDFLWPDERQAFIAEDHILWQAVDSLDA